MGPGAHLSQGYDGVAGIPLLAGEADVVAGDEHLARNMQLAERGPQGTARVAVQALILGQPERGPVPLILGSGIQVSGETKVGWKEGRQELGPGQQEGASGPWFPYWIWALWGPPVSKSPAS